MILREGKLGGTGGDLLTREINAARFVLVGETHFTQKIPQFVSAVCRVMHPDAYAVEAGPLMTGFVAGQLHDPERALHISAELDREPESIAFLNMREENDLAANCAEISPSHFELWDLTRSTLERLVHFSERCWPPSQALCPCKQSTRHRSVNRLPNE